MPTVPVVAEELFERLGREYTENELETLCFAFGVELDDVTEHEGQKVLKIDVPANRYDLLCVEGLGRALKVFTSPSPQSVTPTLRLAGAPKITMVVKPSTKGLRPFIACAILRGVKLNARRLNSFIDLQDKLHHTLCRRRTLASIGTYDMQHLHPPFTYEALPPNEILFRPLGCGSLHPMNGSEILAHFANHQQLKQYLHMLEGQPKLYVLRDSEGQVLSMPPLINSDFCRLTEHSKDVFIDCTSVDAKRGEMVLTLTAAMFSEYCEEPFTIEPVRVVHEEEGRETICPCLDTRNMSVDIDIVRRICGLKDLGVEEAAKQLQRLMLPAQPDPQAPQSHVMHACDVAEDVAIGVGFDRLPVVNAPKLPSNPRSLLTQSMRSLLASLGYTECLTFALCSAEDNAESLKKPLHPPFEPTTAYDPLEHQWSGLPVLLSNAKTRELTETRTQLMSGVLKALANNVGRREMPLRLFEIGDVVIRDDRTETKSRNVLYCCAAFADEHGSGLEEVHGLVDAALEALGLIGDYAVAERQAALAAGKKEQRESLRTIGNMRTFSLKPTTREVEIRANREIGQEAGKKTAFLTLGYMGTLHVDCLRAFGLAVPVSVVEFTLEPFLEWLPDTELIFA